MGLFNLSRIFPSTELKGAKCAAHGTQPLVLRDTQAGEQHVPNLRQIKEAILFRKDVLKVCLVTAYSLH